MLDLRDYLCRNQVALRNYAQDRRDGLRISSAQPSLIKGAKVLAHSH